MPSKINKSKYNLSGRQLDTLKKQINDPRYVEQAVSWIAKHLAAKISSLQ